MSSVHARAVLATAMVLAMASAAIAQNRPYIGYAYPAGGQQGTTFRVKLGGQNLDGVNSVTVSGEGVSGKVVEYLRKLGTQEMTLLREQLNELKKHVPAKSWATLMEATDDSEATMGSEIGMVSQEMMSQMTSGSRSRSITAAQFKNLGIDQKILDLVIKIRTRSAEYVQRPASAAIASLVVAEVTIAADAAPGERELRIVGARGVSNPLVFCVGQSTEASRVPMVTSEIQVLGKEALALRRQRDDNDEERRVTMPCTVNGQIGSAEVHRYRFTAKQSQGLVISSIARGLIPFVADAVPGWFQPVLTLYDAKGREVAYNDDNYFDPDPLIAFRAPKTGEYVVAITDAIYRGREDFVYRVTIDESPLVTSIFPLGGPVGTTPMIDMKGWNLEGAQLKPPPKDAKAGIYTLRATKGKQQSNRVPFALDTLPESFDKESNNDIAHAQKVECPLIVNGRIDQADDWDVFQFSGRRGETIVAEVLARRLNSPLDSLVKITDASGKLLAINDDFEDPEAGANTHYADSYIMFKLPEDGTYFVHLGDTTRSGGEKYAYRLRISGPRPDFALRVMPSSVALRRGNSETVSVFIDRKDGFDGPVRLGLKDAPAGISTNSVTINGKDLVTRLTIKADSSAKFGLCNLMVQGSAQAGSTDLVRDAVPAEDRMQAFLWRHLVPAQEFKAYVVDPNASSSKSRARPQATSAAKPAKGGGSGAKFTKDQVAGRMRQLNYLYDEGLLSVEFYRERMAECEAAK